MGIDPDAEGEPHGQPVEVTASHEACIARVLDHRPFDPEALAGPLERALEAARTLRLHEWMDGLIDTLVARFRGDGSEQGELVSRFLLLRLGKYQAGVGRFDRAAALHREYIDRFCEPAVPTTHLHHLAGLHEQAGDRHAAVQCLVESLARYEAAEPPASAGDLWPVLWSLGRLYLSDGDTGRAEAVLSRLVPLLKSDPRQAGSRKLVDAVDRLAGVYRTQGRDGEARALLASVDRPRPGIVILEQGSLPGFLVAHPLVALALVDPSDPGCDRWMDMLAEVAPGYPGVAFAQVDAIRAPVLAAQMNVHALPTLVAWKDAAVASVAVGAPTRAALHDWLAGLSGS